MPRVHWLACWMAGWVDHFACWFMNDVHSFYLASKGTSSFSRRTFFECEHFSKHLGFCFVFIFVFTAVWLSEFTVAAVAASGLQWTVRARVCVFVCACAENVSELNFLRQLYNRRQLNIHEHTQQLSILELRLKCKFIFKKSKLLHVFVSVFKSTPQTHTRTSYTHHRINTHRTETEHKIQ